MPSYTVTIATGSQWFAGTDDYIYITLVGTERCSERTLLDKPLYNDFERGAVSESTRTRRSQIYICYTVHVDIMVLMLKEEATMEEAVMTFYPTHCTP